MTIDELRAALYGVDGKKELVIISSVPGTVFEVWAISDCIHDVCVLVHVTPPSDPCPRLSAASPRPEDDGKGRSLAV